MRFLFDTHVLLWSLEDDPKLSTVARTLLEDATQEPLLSVASLWEMAIKVGLGKLERKRSFAELMTQKLEPQGIAVLSILPAHLDVLTDLPLHHRDPFDRLIVAQCLAEGVPLLSRDGELDAYGLTRLW